MNASSKYRVPASTQRFELEIKRSRFITTVGHTKGTEQAQQFIRSLKEEFPDANHNCWAFIAGMPDDVFQVDKSDDGEPRGTAGKPMLHVLKHSGLAQVSVVVTRFFGGIKLGAGGLVRAYSQCVSDAMKQLQTTAHLVVAEIQIVLPYSLLDRVEHWVSTTEVEIVGKDYSALVSLCLHVPINQLDEARFALNELGQGQINWQPTIEK